MITFIHDSDLHYKKNGPRSNKASHVQKIIDIDPDFIIVTGDLTDNGFDGSHIFCWNYGGDENQLKTLKTQYIKPIEDVDIPVYLCNGNHDYAEPMIPYRPVHDYIKKKHGSLKYSFIKEGLKFICCGKYPNDLKWLKKQLRDIDQPTIIYFHYNLTGPYSDWWSTTKKNKFYDTIKNHKILAILVGHHHKSNISHWNNIPIIKSGNQFHIINYDIKTQTIIKIGYK